MRSAHFLDRGLNPAPIDRLVSLALPLAFGGLLRGLALGPFAMGVGVFTFFLVIEANDARFAPGVSRESTFVANWTDDPVQIGTNKLAPGLKVKDRR
jgi:hypothetical protein